MAVAVLFRHILTPKIQEGNDGEVEEYDLCSEVEEYDLCSDNLCLYEQSREMGNRFFLSFFKLFTINTHGVNDDETKILK